MTIPSYRYDAQFLFWNAKRTFTEDIALCFRALSAHYSSRIPYSSASCVLFGFRIFPFAWRKLKKTFCCVFILTAPGLEPATSHACARTLTTKPIGHFIYIMTSGNLLKHIGQSHDKIHLIQMWIFRVEPIETNWWYEIITFWLLLVKSALKRSISWLSTCIRSGSIWWHTIFSPFLDGRIVFTSQPEPKILLLICHFCGKNLAWKAQIRVGI